jgi:peroxiredoxin
MGANKTDRILTLAMALAVAGRAWAIADGIREKVVNVGDKAPDFRITADNGRVITRSDFGGKLLVLNFWATWCPPCVEELPSLNEFQRRLADAGVVVVGVSVDQDAREYRAFLEKAKVSFVTARDPSADISGRYGTFKFPETYVIDSRGRVRQKHIGPENWANENLIRSVRALL